MDLLDQSNQADKAFEEQTRAKWKDKPLEEVLTAKVESDRYIRTLETQKDELRTDYKKLWDENQNRAKNEITEAKLQALVDQLEARSLTLDTRQPNADGEKKPVIDPIELQTLVSKQFDEVVKQRKASENFNKVQEKLKETLGGNYAEVLKDRMNTLGISNESMNALAKESPDAFFNTFGINPPQRVDSFQPPVRSQQRMDTFAPKTEKRNYAYYQALKAKDPRIYHDPKIAVQMDKDSQELGMAFFEN